MTWHICRPLVSPRPASQGGPPKPSPVECLRHRLDCDLSHSSFSAPFHRAPRVQPALGVCNGPRGDQAIENARRPRRRKVKRLVCRGTAAVRVWGSPMDYGESPQKIGWWGAKRVEERNSTHDIGF